MNAYGLTEKDLETVNQILATCPRIEKVTIFGSRAKGNFRPGSDLDLALFGDMTHHDQLNLSGLFYESQLPWKVDLVPMQPSTLPELARHIERVGKLIYERESIAKTT